MGLASIWDDQGNYLKSKPRSTGFRARSTGCSCCSSELETEDEVKREAINSLAEILVAKEFFRWSLPKLMEAAKDTEKFKQFKPVQMVEITED